jgi:hypothetical protein
MKKTVAHFPRKPLFTLLALLASQPVFASTPQVADTSTVIDKVFAAYQGWFHCPGGPGPESDWFHWTYISQLPPTQDNVSVPSYPITDEYPASARCPVPGLTVNGQQAYFFSSLDPGTAQTHFRWMREYGIDGAMMQRFVGSLDEIYAENDVVLKNAMQAAGDNGRSFFIEYDVSGDFENTTDQAGEDAIFNRITSDWQHLVNDLHLTDNAMYQHQAGRPVVSFWGIAQGGSDVTWQMKPALAIRIADWFHNVAHATIEAGVGNGYLDLTAYANVIPKFDIIQPWNVGVYDDDMLASYKQTRTVPHVAATAALGQIYMPTIIPSSFGRDRANGNEAIEGTAKSLGGKFFWDQAYMNRSAGVRTVKIAMFDEVGEGTAIIKLAANASQAPSQYPWLTLDVDGDKLPTDWNLRVAHEIVSVFHGTAPLTVAMPTDPGPFDIVPECGVLHPNEILDPAHPLTSCDGKVSLAQGADGNVAVYRDGKALYSTNTAGIAIGTTLMQGDGNLVAYDKTGKPRWSSGTNNHPGAYLYLRNDGTTWIVGADGTPVWQASP